MLPQPPVNVAFWEASGALERYLLAGSCSLPSARSVRLAFNDERCPPMALLDAGKSNAISWPVLATAAHGLITWRGRLCRLRSVMPPDEPRCSPAHSAGSDSRALKLTPEPAVPR